MRRDTKNKKILIGSYKCSNNGKFGPPARKELRKNLCRQRDNKNDKNADDKCLGYQTNKIMEKRKRLSPGVTWTKSPDRETTMSNNNFTNTFKRIIGKKVKVFETKYTYGV